MNGGAVDQLTKWANSPHMQPPQSWFDEEGSPFVVETKPVSNRTETFRGIVALLAAIAAVCLMVWLVMELAGGVE